MEEIQKMFLEEINKKLLKLERRIVKLNKITGTQYDHHYIIVVNLEVFKFYLDYKISNNIKEFDIQILNDSNLNAFEHYILLLDKNYKQLRKKNGNF